MTTKKALFRLWVLLAAIVAGPALAGTIAQDPLFISAQADPRVLLLMSRDHQLFIKAYTDYSDLDGDGTLDITYKDGIEYDGYFNPRKCYTYQNNRFEPTADATGANGHECTQKWSGNFLNWGTMTRMDIVRKVLYGGYRSTDDETATVLERALLPIDVHSFAKVYNPGSTTAMGKVTPYTDQTAISLCNVTLDESTATTRDSTVVPIIRVANGSWPRWASAEVRQCKTAGGVQPASVRADLNARVLVCNSSGDSLDGPGPRCKQYPKTGSAKKPIGLLQQYGDPDVTQTLRFGLMTGSWGKNKSGGVLRRNVGQISNNSGNYKNLDCTAAGNGASSGDEINYCTGVFVNNQQYARSASSSQDLPSVGGIIGTINRLRISSYKMSDAKYQNGCDSPGITSFTDGKCVDWGNPLSEMYLEALRYLRAGDGSGASPRTDFNVADSSYITGLPQLTWTDPIPSTEWCAKSNIVILSTGLNSFDTDQTAHDLGWSKTTIELTNQVADASHESLSGSYMIGSNSGSTDYQSICTAKSFSGAPQGFADFVGICPEAPAIGGSYHIAGLALGTSLFDLRPQYQSQRSKLWSNTKPEYAARQPLTTFAVALAENLPQFSIPVGAGKISFLPACQANSNSSALLSDSGWRTCSMTDLIVEAGSDNTKGSFLISWEDSPWGNDYDMDGISHIRYCVGAACTGQPGFSGIPGTNTLYIKVAAMQAAAGHALKFGYTVTGSTADGSTLPVLRPGGKDYDYAAGYETTPPAGSTWTVPQWIAYTPGFSTGKLLENPLWYTAKYAAWPNWDVKSNNASRSPGADNIPDNFFRVTNPAGLAQAVSAALKESLADSSSASSIATNSTRLDTDTYVYQARFKAIDWSGQVLAYPLKSDGSLDALAWDAATSAKIPAASDRWIYTFNRSAATKGIDFKWGSGGLSSLQKQALDNGNSGNASSPVLDYLRGDQSQERKDTNGDGAFDTGVYRPRPTSVFGDVINSDPLFVGAQNFNYNSVAAIAGYDSYSVQLAKKIKADGSVRNPLVLMNANDGMMHAIDAKNGNEIFTYVPSWLVCNNEGASACTSGNDSSPLRNLADPNYQHRYFLDGPLVVGDSYIDVGGGNAWRTVLVGAAGAGGKGVFALDLTKSYDGSGTPGAGDTLATTRAVYANLTAANMALWEFTDKDYVSGAEQDGDGDLGYTFGVPIIGRLANGDWAAIFANGYGSATGKAVLYAVNLATGRLIKKIDVGDGSSTASPNGLSSPAAVFDSASGALTKFYAGDLKGNLWKFDLSSSNPNSWGVEHGSGKPLFVARSDSGTRQPITASLEIGTHTEGGYMIYFGTGQYFEKNDNSSTDLQTLYAIWDTLATNDDIPDASTDTAAEKAGVLQKHEILVETANPFNANQTIRATDSIGAVTWAGSGAKRGWYMNLVVKNGVQQGERVVSAPILRNRRIIFTTLTPSQLPCEFGGSGWIMELDPMTGNRLGESTFDLNGDGSFTNTDYVTINVGGTSVMVPASGIKSTEGIIKTPAIIAAGGKEYKIGSGTTGNVMVVSEKGATNRPRTSWRQIQ